MGKIKTLVVGLMTLSLIATILMTTLPGNVSASPSWQVGDKWALAGEKDIGQIWDGLSEQIANELNNSGPPMNITLSSSSFQGKITMNALFEVKAVTATNVTVQISIAANLTISASAVVNANLPPAGTYNLSNGQPTFVNKDFTVNVKLVAASSGTITTVITNDTKAIESMDAAISSYVKGDVTVKNCPNVVYNNQAHTEITLSYSDSTFSIDANAITGMHAVVSPAMQIVFDSMVIGDIRTANANVTATETISGSANVGNVPAFIRDQIFTSDIASNGITGFPIDLAKIYNPDPNNGIPINNGTIATRNGPMQTSIAYLRDKNVDDAISGSVSAREYGLQSSGSTDVFTFLLDPTNGHALGSTSTIPMGNTTVIFTTHAAPVNSTQTTISKIDTQVTDRQTYATVTGTNGGTGGGTSGISSDMLIIIGVVLIVVVAAIAGVMVMRRKK